MNDAKAIQFLKILSAKEIKGLKVFVTNPYFNINQKEEVIQLYEYIIGFAPNYNASDFTRENAFKATYPNKIFDPQDLNRLMNRLFTLIKKFISCIYSTSHLADMEFNVLRSCANRFPLHFNKQLGRVKDIAKRDLKGGDLYHYMLKVEELHADHLGISGRDNLSDFAQRLDQYYALSKLPLLCEMLNRQNLLRAAFDFSNLDTYLTFFEQIESTQFPLVQLWHCAASTLENTSDEHLVQPDDYLRLKELINQNKNKLNSDERRNLFVYQGNALKTLLDDDKYYSETFELYQNRLKEKGAFVRGYLTARTVKNTITAAVKTNNIEWAEHFLEVYSPRFDPEHAQQTIVYCRALIDFCKGNFEAALDQMEEFEHEDIFFRLGREVMLLQIYFELGDNDDEFFDLFYKHLEDFRDNLTALRARNRLAPEWVQSYRNFRMFTKKIFETDKEDINKIEAEIQVIPASKLPEKQWLLQKLDELK